MIFLPNLLILLDVTGRFAIILFRNSLDWRAHMKKRSLLKNVCRNLVDSLTSHTKITEDQIFRFMEELAKEEPKALSEMPPDYRRLFFSMGEVWQYQEWKSLSAEQAFLYGGLWGSSKSFDLRYQQKLTTDRMKTLVPKYKSKEWIFRAIKYQPGILHKELADKGHISPSRLSQIMDDTDIDSLISYRLSGREKYYYLKPAGEELLDKLKANGRKVLGSFAEPYKAIRILNDSTRLMYDGMNVFAVGVISNPIMAKTRGYNRLSRVLDQFNSELSIKNIIEVNEWAQNSNYVVARGTNLLGNGLAVSSAK